MANELTTNCGKLPEFNLSEKRFQAFKGKDDVYFGKDIKEFIRLLKEFMFDDNYIGWEMHNYRAEVIQKLDKLAGDELNE